MYKIARLKVFVKKNSIFFLKLLKLEDSISIQVLEGIFVCTNKWKK